MIAKTPARVVLERPDVDSLDAPRFRNEQEIHVVPPVWLPPKVGRRIGLVAYALDTVEEAIREFNIEVRFTDAQGHRWRRDSDGRLVHWTLVKGGRRTKR